MITISNEFKEIVFGVFLCSSYLSVYDIVLVCAVNSGKLSRNMYAKSTAV